MKFFDENLKFRTKKMLFSNDWGQRFFDEHFPIYYSLALKNQAEETGIPKLKIKEDSNSRWVCYFNNDINTGEYYFGYSKKAILNGGLEHKEADLEADLNSLLNILTMPFHEFKHYEQSYILSQSDIRKMSSSSIIYAKEEILKREKIEFYNNHHDEFYIEREAELSAVKNAKSLCESIENESSSPKSRSKMFVSRYDHYIKERQKLLQGYKQKGGFCETISDEVNDVMQNLPPEKLGFYFSKFPILKFLYNKDGTKKSLQQILSDKLDLMEANLHDLQTKVGERTLLFHIEDIYKTIINTDKDLRKEYEDSFLKKEIKRKPVVTQPEINKKEHKFERSI